MATATMTIPSVSDTNCYSWCASSDTDPSPVEDSSIPPPANKATSSRPTYHAIVRTIWRFNRDRLAYRYDPNDKVKQDKWQGTRKKMQSILNRYYDLNPISRDAIDICMDVWSVFDVCVMAFPCPAQECN